MENTRHPLLTKWYLRYLDDADAAGFIASVSQRYLQATLERVAENSVPLDRRGAVLALGFLGDIRCNEVLGRALRDRDRSVRILAENSIREVWLRDGLPAQRQELEILIRLNDSNDHEEVIERATRLIDEAPGYAEVWNQRAIAYFQLRRFEDAAEDCQQTLSLNPLHFIAALGMGHCYLELGEGFAALECFRRSVDLNPELEAVRGQIRYLRRALEDA